MYRRRVNIVAYELRTVMDTVFKSCALRPRLLLLVVYLLALIQWSGAATDKSSTNKNDAFVQYKTPNGIVEGRIEHIRDKRDVVTILGLPFAESPTGDLRFRPPVMAKPWTGVFRADEPAKACIQGRDETFKKENGTNFWGADMWNANTKLSEDCLQMNMWIPKDVKNATVLVWIFGGGFWYGSPSLALYDGRGLAVEGNVIVVNPNYRLGALGFLFLDHPDIPGNMGLLDQQLALKWIQINIASFGGDPKKALRLGHYRNTDIMVGINADEGTFWMVYYLTEFFKPDNEALSLIDESQYVKCVDTAFPNWPLAQRQGVVHQYYDKRCARSVGFYREAVNQIVGDYFFTCDSLWLADRIVNESKGNVYVYHFLQRSSNNPWPKWMGVMHAYEIEYVFGLPMIFPARYNETFETNFSRDVVNWWTTFAENGKPELTYRKEPWPQYSVNNKSYFKLKAGLGYQGLAPNSKAEECLFWRSVRDVEFSEYAASSLGNNPTPQPRIDGT